MDAPELTIVLAIVLPGAAALLGWYLGSRRAQQGRPIVRPSPAWRRAVTGVIVVGAVSAAFVAPVIAVFWALVACNFAFGRGENLPFSTYPMFSQPAEHAWSLRVEDAAGVVIPIAMLGVDPVVARKRFATDEHAAMEHAAGDRDAARRVAAAAFAEQLEQRRPLHGPLASAPITISLIEYVVDAGAAKAVRTPLCETTPG